MKTLNCSRLLLGALLLGSLAAKAQMSHLAQTFTFDGMIYDTDGVTPLNDPAANIKLQIFNPAETCLLFEETHTVNIPNGHFAVKVGTGVRASSAVDGGLGYSSIFRNDGGSTRTSDPSYCPGGYIPTDMEGRKMRVTVNANVMTPSFDLSPVPMATVAETLQGKGLNDFVTTSGNTVLSGYLKVPQMQIANGTYHVTLAAPSLGGNLNFTLPNSLGSSDQVLKTDGTGLLFWATDDTGGGGGGTVSGVTGLAPLTVNNTDPANPILSMSNVGTAGTYGTSNQVPVFTTDTWGRITSVTNTTIAGASPLGTSLPDGHTWVGNVSGMATARYINASDLKTSMGVSQFPAMSCTSSETMSWSAVTDQFNCAMIQINSGNITDGSITMTDLASNIQDGMWSSNAVDVFRTTGSVGIGTAAPHPSAVLDMGQSSRGLILPRLNTTQRSILSGVSGLQIYNSDTNALEYYDGSSWREVATAGAAAFLAPSPGSASAPVFSFQSDTGTGMFRPGAYNLGFSTNGSERVRLTNVGNVGIGTTTPAVKLQVAGAIVGGYQSTASTTIDWATANVITYTGTDCSVGFNFTNMLPGGVYRLVISDISGSMNCSFSQSSPTALTFRYSMGMGYISVGGASPIAVVTIVVAGNSAFVEYTTYPL